MLQNDGDDGYFSTEQPGLECIIKVFGKAKVGNIEYKLVCTKGYCNCEDNCDAFNKDSVCACLGKKKIKNKSCDGEHFVWKLSNPKDKKLFDDDSSGIIVKPSNSGDGNSKMCDGCEYFSHIAGYAPHCHFKGTTKSPKITDNFKCPK